MTGKRRLLQVLGGAKDPAWLNYQYWFQVSKGKILGQGSFRKCYEAVGRKVEDGPLDKMVAKCLKHREAKKGCNKIPKYDEMSSLYTGFNHILHRFKNTCFLIPKVLLMSYWRQRLETLRV